MPAPTRTTLTRSRLLSLRAPIANESERAQFQGRLVVTLLVVFVLGVGFWVMQLAIVAILAPEHIHHLFAYRNIQIQLATAFTGLAGALVLRRGKPSVPFLDVADAALTLAICCGWALMLLNDPVVAPRQELIALLATSYTLATRAALVPSTPARSALIGGLALAPLVPVTFVMHRSEGPDALALGPAIYMMIWIAVAIACTTTISHVIYGLRLEVRKAMQLGQYMLEDKIGEGGMGIVYRASHAMLRRPTAIKLLTGSTGHAAERFEREVQITARLTHPNTVAVFDYGRTPDGVFYYAMEYLDGITLEELVTDFGPQPASRVVHILLQMCGALEEAHRNGLVHRDIKPANVMLTERGCIPDFVKVLDFGLVKESEQQTNLNVSNVNTILGTPHYMAPEAIIDPTKVDARTDLYAAGATAYFLLTGSQVFDGGSLVEVCSQHLHQAPAAPSAKRSQVPAVLDAVVLACLAKKPEDRPASAAALAATLRDCAIGEWTREDAESWWQQPAARARRDATRTDALGEVKPSATDAFGKTVAIALDDRGAA